VYPARPGWAGAYRADVRFNSVARDKALDRVIQAMDALVVVVTLYLLFAG
jgi:hypothetical protein